ncbi:hypothetical protein F5146DRAFT_1133650 [Armillaria mellea]|nr:hypothetical protein F5146DRAFT_1133650 [Armillaria mellea]
MRMLYTYLQPSALLSVYCHFGNPVWVHIKSRRPVQSSSQPVWCSTQKCSTAIILIIIHECAFIVWTAGILADILARLTALSPQLYHTPDGRNGYLSVQQIRYHLLDDLPTHLQLPPSGQ